MLQTNPRFLSFEEYLSYDDGTENLYELFNGELIEVPPESGRNNQIAIFLLLQFARLVEFRRLRGQGLEIEVRGEPKNRFPDITILREDHVIQLQQRDTIRLSMAPPLLVVEIVSPGDLQHDRDYIAKRSQYQDRGIPEYWIVDPQQAAILVLELRAAVYTEVQTLRGDDVVYSSQFGVLDVTARQVFAAGGLPQSVMER